MAREIDKQDAKVLIRSLLTATQRSVNVPQLLREFRQEAGCDLPTYGYKTQTHFLESIPDTVKLVGLYPYQEVCLVASEKSAHVTDLVSKQRDGSKRRRQRAPPRRIIRMAEPPTRFYQPPRERQAPRERLVVPPKFQNQQHSTKNEAPRPVQQLSVYIPQHDKHKLHRFLLSHPYGVHFEELSKIMIDGSSWSNFNIKNGIDELIEHCSGICKVYQGKVFAREHYEELMKKTDEKYKCADPNRVPAGAETDDDGDEFDNYEPYVTENDALKKVEDKEQDSVETASKCSSKLSRSSGHSINEQVKDKLKQLLKNFPRGIWCCDLPELYSNFYNSTLDYREYGFTSLIQMVSELPDIVRFIRPGNGDWMLFDASVPPDKEQENLRTKDSVAESIPNCLKTNLLRLLSSRCKATTEVGVPLSDIQPWYYKMFHKKLDFEGLGFNDLLSFVESLDGTVVHLRKISNQVIVIPIKKEIEALKPDGSALPQITPSDDIFYELFPEDVVGPDESIPMIDLKQYAKVGDYVPVCAAEVCTPNKFYLQLSKYTPTLNELMDDIQVFYTTNINVSKYKMPDTTLRPNQICVGSYRTGDNTCNEEWHRTKIISVGEDQRVTVYFVDYGTQTKILKSQLRFLLKDYALLPCQAFVGHLAHINPANGGTKWPMAANRRLLDLLSVESLLAGVVEIDYETNWMSVSLTDVGEDENIHVSDTLVEEGWANFGEKVIEAQRQAEPKTRKPASKIKMELEEDKDDLFDVIPPCPVACETASVKPEKTSSVPSPVPSNVNSAGPRAILKGSKPVLPTQPVSSSLPEFSPPTQSLPNPTNFVGNAASGIPVLPQMFGSPIPYYSQVVPSVPVMYPQAMGYPALAIPPSLNPALGLLAQSSHSSSAGSRPPPGFGDPRLASMMPSENGIYAQCYMQLQLEQLEQERRQAAEKQAKIVKMALEYFHTQSEIKAVAQTCPDLALKIALQLAEHHYNTTENAAVSSVINAQAANLVAPTTPKPVQKVSPAPSQTFATKSSPKATTFVPVPSEPEATKSNGAPRRTGPMQIKPNIITSTSSSPSTSSALSSTTASSARSSPELISKDEDDLKDKMDNMNIISTRLQTPGIVRHIKEVEVAGRQLHVANVDQKLHVFVDEVIKLCTPFSGRETVERILHSKKIAYLYVTVSRNEKESFFKDLDSIPGLSKTGHNYSEAHLLPLQCVTQFLQTINCMERKFVTDFHDLNMQFDPNDDYWMGLATK